MIAVHCSLYSFVLVSLYLFQPAARTIVRIRVPNGTAAFLLLSTRRVTTPHMEFVKNQVTNGICEMYFWSQVLLSGFRY